MNTIDLTKWCGDDGRDCIKAPFSVGDYTYATNGHVLIRVPRRDEDPDRNQKMLEKIIHCFDDQPSEWLPIPTGIPQTNAVDCDQCDGTGEYTCPTCNHCSGECDYCGGTGTITKRTPIKVGDTHFADVYLNMIASLPNAQIGVLDYPNASRFRFDGGEGLIMPMRV